MLEGKGVRECITFIVHYLIYKKERTRQKKQRNRISFDRNHNCYIQGKGYVYRRKRNSGDIEKEKRGEEIYSTLLRYRSFSYLCGNIIYANYASSCEGA